MSLLVAPAIISLTAADTPVKKVGMRIRHASKEEAQWLDRYTETHEPLGASPLRMVRATPEEEHWLNRLRARSFDTESSAGTNPARNAALFCIAKHHREQFRLGMTVTERALTDVGESHDGEDGAGGSSYIDFDDDNPYVSSPPCH
jgi:hypothetical protein